MVKTAVNNIDQVARKIIQQTITQGGREVERTAPLIKRLVVEELYTPFCLLGSFGKIK